MNTGIQDAVNLGWKLVHVISQECQGHKVSEDWLDSYDEERRRVGMHLLEGTDRAFGYGASTNYFWVLWRNFFVTWIMPWLVSNRERRAGVFRFITQLGIRYRFSPITRASSGTWKVKGGDRAPDGKVGTGRGEKWLSEMCEGDRHHLILFSGTRAQRIQPGEMDAVSARFEALFATTGLDKIRIHKVCAFGLGDETALSDLGDKLHDSFGFEGPGYVLVRPDGYVACLNVTSQLEEFFQWVKTYAEK